MISLRKSLEQLSDRERHQAAVRAFHDTVEASARYAVEVDPQEADLFRKHMLHLAQQVSRTVEQREDPDDYSRLGASIASAFQYYGSRSRQRIERMRQELQSAGEAMGSFAAGMQEGSNDYERTLRREMTELRTAVEGDDLPRIRNTVLGAVAEIQKSYQTLKQQNEAVMTQLRDEIRTLHQQLEQNVEAGPRERREIMSAASFDARVEERMRSNKSFFVLMLGLAGLSKAREFYPPEVVHRYLEQQLESLTRVVGDMGKVGSWNENVFLVLMDDSRAMAAKLAQRANAILREPLRVNSREGTVEIQLEATSEIIERTKGESAAAFYVTLGRAAEQVVRS